MKKLYAIFDDYGLLKEIKGFTIGENPSNSTDSLPVNLIEPIFINGIWCENISKEGAENRKVIQLNEAEFQYYLKRKYDGENAYLKISAEFRQAKLSGKISEETHSYIEEILTPVRNEVMFGQWKKALSILENIGFLQIGVDLYDRLHTQISNYIIENY